jgi:hypothetical protein
MILMEALQLNPMNNESMEDGIASFDFQHIFPHMFWISNWSVDETYPSGV